MSMILRVHAVSPFCRKVLAAVRMTRRPVQVVEAPLTRELRALGHLPLLETERGAVVHGLEIVAHIIDGENALIPDGDEVRDLDRIIDLYLLEAVVTMACHPDTGAARAAEEAARRTLALMDDRLARAPWLCGDRVTLADLGAAVGASDLERLGVTLPDRVQLLLSRCRSTPGLGQVLAEGDALWTVLWSEGSQEARRHPMAA